MDPAQIAAVKDRFTAFNIHNVIYQTINDHAITVDILIPTNVKPGKHPVIVSFHGGYLITGSSLFPGLFLPWIMDLALKHSAILLRPNYRKLPESTGLQILEGLAEFWKWFRRGGPQAAVVVGSATEGEVEVDEGRTLLIGHSAGAYLALQSAITQPANTFKALIVGYGMLDMTSPWFTKSFEKHPLGSPMLPPSLIDDHLAAITPGQVVSAVTPPLRVPLAQATVQYGRYPEMLGDDASLYPLEMLKGGKCFPKVFAYHGRDDLAVEVEQTKAFVKRCREVMPDGRLLVRYERGDHGFDKLRGLETPWLKEGLEFVTEEWLG